MPGPSAWPLYVSYLALFISLVMIGVSNGTVLLESGFGASKTQIKIWSTCTPNRCFSVTSNSQCSELSSRMKAVGAFSILGAMAILGLGGCFYAEANNVRLPVNHLSKVIFAWCLAPLMVCIGVSIGTMVAKLCSDPLPLTERNGEFGPAFYTFFVALFMVVISGGLFAWHKLRSARAPTADDDDTGALGVPVNDKEPEL